MIPGLMILGLSSLVAFSNALKVDIKKVIKHKITIMFNIMMSRFSMLFF